MNPVRFTFDDPFVNSAADTADPGPENVLRRGLGRGVGRGARLHAQY